MTDELVETSPIADIYADGIASVEVVSDVNVRITYFAHLQVPGEGSVRIVCARLVRPLSSIVSGQVTSMLHELEPKKQTE